MPVNYAYRAEVIASGLVQEYKRLKHETYLASFLENDEIEYLSYEKLFLELEDPEAFNEARKIEQADRKRTSRLRHRITDIISRPDPVFCTLTFTDEILEKTNEKQRRRYVTEYLKTQSSFYVANIDYGGLNGREHYHACISGRVDPSKWRYGSLNCRQILVASDPLRLARYINKLVNHAVKETTSQNRVIYSRSTGIDERNAFQDRLLYGDLVPSRRPLS